MIAHKTGDLVLAFVSGEVDVIAHQANCFNTMRSGVAKAIVDEFPIVAEVDGLTAKGSTAKLGTFSVAEAGYPAGLVYNLYGQYHYGRDGGLYTIYEALECALVEMANDLSERAYDGRIGFPKIGCGLAGGDWSIVEKIIEKHFSDWEVIVYSLEDE